MSTFKYPPQAANGKLLLSSDPLPEAIKSAVSTRLGERILRNTYGTDSDEFRTVNGLESYIVRLTEAIYDSCQEYQPFAMELSGKLTEEGVALISIRFNNDNELNITL